MTTPTTPATSPEESPVLSATSGTDEVDVAVSAARRVITSLLRAGSNTSTDMVEVAAKLNAVADQLDHDAPGMDERMVEMWEGEGAIRHDPATGPENAIAPPLPLTGDADGSISGQATLDLQYQGPPGYVHGGVSALLLDHALGTANGWAGRSGMTAELTLRYRRPTPLFEPLTVTARQVSVDGSKIRTSGAISAGGRDCVNAEGLFIARHPPRPR